MIDQLQDTEGAGDVLLYLDGDSANHDISNMIIVPEEMLESRTYKCFCGAQFVIRFPENCNWDDYESGALEDAGWVLRGRDYRCPLHAGNESSTTGRKAEKTAREALTKYQEVKAMTENEARSLKGGALLVHRNRGKCEFMEMDAADPSGSTVWVRLADGDECMVSTGMLTIRRKDNHGGPMYSLP